MSRGFLLACVVTLSSVAAHADVWLIGGGYDLEHSQGQIEANVRWLEDLLLARGNTVHTYFALGDEPGHDVVYRATAAELGDTAAHEPLLRVFGLYQTSRLRYKRHELRAVRGSTDKQDLAAALLRDLSAASADVMLVYNGHGGIDRSDTRNNHLKLWDDQRMTVAELETLLDAAPRDRTVRFVMTQCYSGAFHSMIYDDPLAEEGFRGNRCGFMSESAHEMAEGCTLDLDQQEYRDYATYFFAALAGVTRSGEALPLAAVDRDRDGVTSYREAHLHALVAAESSDLSRSTSEQFLENWSPWYLRWDSHVDNRDSVYWALAGDVARKYGWDADAASLEKVRSGYLAALDDAEQRRSRAELQIEALRETLKQHLTQGRPDLVNIEHLPAHVPRARWSELAPMIHEHEQYTALVHALSDLQSLARESRENTRALTQIDKIYRLRHLARLEQGLRNYGSRQARSHYDQLLQCESGAPPGAQSVVGF